MVFVSEIIGKAVSDYDGHQVGILEDLIASFVGDIPHPKIVALSVKQSRGTNLYVPFSDVAVFIAPAVPLNKRVSDIIAYTPLKDDLFLARDVLDKQIIDTNGVRVVRVNDLELTRVNGSFYVANVDVGGLGLLRRLGVAKTTQKIANRFGREMTTGGISWDDVELIPGSQAMRLKVPGDRLSELHPADLAEIISDLGRADSSKFLESLSVERLADTLEEVEPDFQASLVETMPDEKIADLLEEMAPDEAADLLAELPEDRSQELLKLMEKEDAEDVRKLLAYPEDTAGGIMTTEYIEMRPHLLAKEALKILRETGSEAETIAYIYVTDSDHHLLGVFSLRDLVMAEPNTPITEFMHHRLVTINLTDSQEDVAQAISKYNLIALPVIDEQRRMHGIVTADDALDKIIPTAWKKRLPRLYR